MSAIHQHQYEEAGRFLTVGLPSYEGGNNSIGNIPNTELFWSLIDNADHNSPGFMSSATPQVVGKLTPKPLIPLSKTLTLTLLPPFRSNSSFHKGSATYCGHYQRTSDLGYLMDSSSSTRPSKRRELDWERDQSSKDGIGEEENEVIGMVPDYLLPSKASPYWFPSFQVKSLLFLLTSS